MRSRFRSALIIAVVAIAAMLVISTTPSSAGLAKGRLKPRKATATTTTAPALEETTTTAPPATTTTAPPATTTTTAPPATTTTAPPAPTTTVPPAPAPSGSPARDAIIAGAGLLDAALLRPSGGLTLNVPGAVVQNLDVSGGITIAANNVTIRNVRVTGSSSGNLVKTLSGVTGTVIENCEVHITTAGANGAIGGSGKYTTVRRCKITGYADGIKAESNSLYELNYVNVYKPAGSEKHLDGLQGSGDTKFTVRNNVIEAPAANGGNSAIFVQSYNGTANYLVEDVLLAGNYLLGGNYTVFFEGGKTHDGTDPKQWIRNHQAVGNVFASTGYRYGPIRVTNCAQTTLLGNVMTDGSLLKNPCG